MVPGLDEVVGAPIALVAPSTRRPSPTTVPVRGEGFGSWRPTSNPVFQAPCAGGSSCPTARRLGRPDTLTQ